MGQRQDRQEYVIGINRLQDAHHLQLAAQVAVRKHHAFGRRGGTRSVNDRREIIPVRYGYGAKRIGSLVDHPEVHAAHHEVQPGDDLLRDLREQFIGNDERFGLGMQDDLVEFGARKIRQDGYDHHARHGRGKISDAPVRHVVAQQRDFVATVQPGMDEYIDQGVDAFGELGVGERLSPVHRETRPRAEGINAVQIQFPKGFESHCKWKVRNVGTFANRTQR